MLSWLVSLTPCGHPFSLAKRKLRKIFGIRLMNLLTSDSSIFNKVDEFIQQNVQILQNYEVSYVLC